MLSRNSLVQLKKELKELDQVIDVVISNPLSDKPLFDSEQDYYDSLRAQNKVPQDYYRFRFFDVELSIEYNLKTKKYFFVHESLDGKRRYTSNEFDEFHVVKDYFLTKVKEYCLGKLGELF